MSQLRSIQQPLRSARRATPTRLNAIHLTPLINVSPVSPHSRKIPRDTLRTPESKHNESSTTSQAYSPSKSRSSRLVSECSPKSGPGVTRGSNTKLMGLFGLELTDSKVGLLSEERLSTTIEKIFSFVFARNTALLKQDLLQKEMERQHAFVKDVWAWATSVYIEKKLIAYNIGVLVKSLAYNLDRQPTLQTQIFVRFLEVEYRYKELLFFLFCRLMIENELATSFDRRKAVGVENLHLSEDNANNVVLSIGGKHLDILANLYETFSRFFRTGKRLTVYRCLELLVEDYQAKRPASNNPNPQPSPKKQPPAYERLFESIESEVAALRNRHKLASSPIAAEDESCWSVEEGASLLELSPAQSRFWKQQPFVESEALLHCFEHRELLQAMLAKMRGKVGDLVDIMYSDQEPVELPRQRLQELLADRACSLLVALFRMDKLLWMRLLCIERPDPQQLQRVEELQLTLRKIVRAPQPKAISELCKQILTTDQFKRQIQRLVVV